MPGIDQRRPIESDRRREERMVTYTVPGYGIKQFCKTKGHNFKGIVSRDWAELSMIPVDSSQVFSSAGSYFFYSFSTTFSCLNI